MAKPSSSNAGGGETEIEWLSEFIEQFKPYQSKVIDKCEKGREKGCDEANDTMISVELDCSYRDSADRIVKFTDKYPDFNLVINRRCDACQRDGIENEIVYCCLECDGQYDECEDCHKKSTHHHPNSFEKQEPITSDNNETETGTTNDTSNESASNESDSNESDSNESASNESTTKVDTSEKYTIQDLVLYGEGIERRLILDREDEQYEELYPPIFIDTIQMDPDKCPPMVKRFQWRDWFKRTDGIAKVYSARPGGILLRCPDFYIELKQP